MDIPCNLCGMKLLLFLALVFLISCGESKEEKQVREANELIERTKRNYSSDSIQLEQQRQIDEALIKAGKEPKR